MCRLGQNRSVPSARSQQIGPPPRAALALSPRPGPLGSAPSRSAPSDRTPLRSASLHRSPRCSSALGRSALWFLAASVMLLVRPAPAFYHFSASAAWLSSSVLCPAAPIVHVSVDDGFWPSALFGPRSFGAPVLGRSSLRPLRSKAALALDLRVCACMMLCMYAVVLAGCCACMLLCMHAVFLCVCRFRHPRIDILGSNSLGSALSQSNPSSSRRLRSPIGLGV